MNILSEMLRFFVGMYSISFTINPFANITNRVSDTNRDVNNYT
jgi:hypothetical protein